MSRRHFHRHIRRFCSEVSSISEQNRRRAEEYLRRFAAAQSLQYEPVDATTMRKEVKPTAKEISLLRIHKLIPPTTGLPPPSSLITLLEDAHGASEITHIDIADKASFANWMILCTALSERHVNAVANGLQQDLRALDVKVGSALVHATGGGGWSVVDLGIGVVHVMTEEMREFYDVDSLWMSDASP